MKKGSAGSNSETTKDIQELKIEYEKKIDLLEQELAITKAEAEAARREMDLAVDEMEAIKNAFFWRVTAPARFVVAGMKELPEAGKKAAVLFKKGVKSLKEKGVVYTWKKVLRRADEIQTYSEWIKTPLFTEEELDAQRREQFDKDIVFSITVPLYNTPAQFLQEMIDSVREQTYSKWELCLADGSDSEHADVERICKEYAAADKRIKYQKLEKNLGISENTNACIDMATGDYIALFDHDDILHPAALHEMMKAVCEQDADFIYTDEATFESPNISRITLIHFKPDYAPDNLRGCNYICHFTAFRKSLLDKTGGFRKAFDGSQDHDLVLRLTAVAEKIVHIPEVLYFWRAHPQSVAMTNDAKNYAAIAGQNAVKTSLESQGITATVESSRALPSIYRVRYAIKGEPKISIVIPTCDHIDDLDKCIASIEEKSTYKNYEIILVENNSKNKDTFDYYKTIQKRSDRIKVISWNGIFNYSAINNYGVKEAATGDYILLLNNDIEVITPEWMEEMLMYAQRKDVGAVGAMLYYPDDTIQHAGVILGVGGIAGHAFLKRDRGDIGYIGNLCYARDVTAVTAACMMIRRDVWEEVGGLRESFVVAFNDIDLCMRIRKAGYLIVWTPYAELYHYESKSRGYEDTPEKKRRFNDEKRKFLAAWPEEMAAGDPYYNPNFALYKETYSLTEQQGQPGRK